MKAPKQGVMPMHKQMAAGKKTASPMPKPAKTPVKMPAKGGKKC